MMKVEVRAFKGRLKGYRYWQLRERGQAQMLELLYDLIGASPKSPKLDGIQVHSPKNLDKEYRIREEIERVQANLSHAQAEIKYVDEILDKIESPLREAIIDIYADNIKMECWSKKMDIATSTLNSRIDKAIEKALANY